MMRHSENNTRMGLVISLCLNSNHLISLITPPPPQTASNFRHLLSCGTIEVSEQFPQLSILFSNYLRALKFLAPSTFQNNSNVICSLSLNPKKVIHDLSFGSIILAWTLEHTYNDLIGLILLVSQCQTTSNM